MWFYKDHVDTHRLHGLRVCTKNHTGTNGGSIVYVVLHIIILVQMEAPEVRLFNKESYWYK
jgi:hypothetical protein